VPRGGAEWMRSCIPWVLGAGEFLRTCEIGTRQLEKPHGKLGMTLYACSRARTWKTQLFLRQLQSQSRSHSREESCDRNHK
jgi:hypothetical protein